jgi:methylaspartate mutase epsilon subunit
MHGCGRLVVQPRMGFSSPEMMRAGLCATRDAHACTVGTITLDSFTRVGDHGAARRALDSGDELNGFPLVAHGTGTTNTMLAGLQGPDFPVQVRHGTALPDDIVAVLVDTYVDATEGGPVSYTLPYGRTPLDQAVASWARCSHRLVEKEGDGVTWHIETFGGCMLGQLCPPELLVALSVLEAIFFARHGLASVSLSYAQQTNAEQDAEALAALRTLAAKHLPGVEWHLVLYSWMGLFPRTAAGARRLMQESVAIARTARVERLMVKTSSEANRIPTIAENIAALEAADSMTRANPFHPVSCGDTGILDTASDLVGDVLNESEEIGKAILRAFQTGRLDVPYCVHPDNRNRARSYIDGAGWLRWSHSGAMPITVTGRCAPVSLTAAEFLAMLDYNRRRFDPVDGESPSVEPIVA